MSQPTDPFAQAYARYEQLEGKLSSAVDQLVATNGFAELFTSSATNVMALVRMTNGAVDQAVRLTRLAVKQDVVNLARQLARTEDKLERLLQLVEELEGRLAAAQQQAAATAAGAGERGASGEPTGTGWPQAEHVGDDEPDPIAEAVAAKPAGKAGANGTRRRKVAAADAAAAAAGEKAP